MSTTQHTHAEVIHQQAQAKFKLHTVEDLFAMPEPEWLIEDFIDAGAFTVLYGPPESGKSFIALDWALSMTVGKQWHGRDVKKGKVVYVVAEGTRGVPKRVKAWMRHHNIKTAARALFVLEAARLHTEKDQQLLVEAIKPHKPLLVVFDTFAQCFLGGDENSSTEVSEWVEGCRLIREHTGAAVVTVHHTTKKSTTTERGSSALRAAADSMFLVKHNANTGVSSIETTKQKDDERPETIFLRRKRLKLGVGPKGNDITSCVLELVESPPPSGGAESAELNGSLFIALEVLVAEGIARSGDWRVAIEKRTGNPVSKNTFPKWIPSLKQKGYVESVPDKLHCYRPTEKGLVLVSATEAKAA